MDILERLERKEAMRAEYQRRSEILKRHEYGRVQCLITEHFNVPCGMLPAVTELDDGSIDFYHKGCCSEAHHLLYDEYTADSGLLLKKTLETRLKRVVDDFSFKIAKLIEEYGREEVYECLNFKPNK